MADQYGHTSMEEDDIDGLMYDDDDEPELSEIDDRWFLVGRFLTKRSIDFQAMQHKMATLWQPGRGMLDFWVQIHDITSGFKSETVVRDVGNYVGTFVKIDPNNFSGVWRDFLRVRSSIRVDQPLQGKLKLEEKSGLSCLVHFKYEDLPTFYFICGILGHSERFCERLFDTPLHLIDKPYNKELKAAPRRRNYASGAQWLRSGVVTRSTNLSPTVELLPVNFGSRQNINVAAHNQQSVVMGHTNFMVINGEDIIHDSTTNNGNQGVEIGSSVQGKSKDKAVLVDNDESQTNHVLLLVDTKRRRTDIEPNASNGPLSEKSDGPTILHNENGSMLEDENVESNTNGPEAMEDESTMGSYGVYFSKNLVGAGCSEMINLDLDRPVTEEEVCKAVFDMHPDKSPRPDGMTPAFFQKCWPIVKTDVVAYVQHFFEHGVLEKTCAAANVVSIPKKKCPDSMKDLRPIALCNVIYKVITKVMANRMKPFMDTIIVESQSAFIPGRLISDNVLISFEVLHYLKRKRLGKTGFMALKIDMSKAYDRIEWSFLEAMLRRMGFLDKWVKLVMSCVASATYTVIHGKHEIGPITPTRGIRQGDPLFPYLFIMCAEGLSAMLRKYENNGWIHGCKVANGAPQVSHMLFADDSYYYCKATMEEARRIHEFLQKFERASGQQVNFSKSSIFFSTNMETNVRNQLCSFLGMNAATEDNFYLGLPSTMSRNKTAGLGYLKTKSVVQSLPSYAMSVFLLPLDITRDIEKLMNRFWWQPKGDKKGSKVGEFLQSQTYLYRGFSRQRYFPHGSFLSAQIGAKPSFVWRSIFEAQDLWKSGIRCDRDKQLIVSIPLKITQNNDQLFWCRENLGICSIKSAYSTLQKLKGRWFEDEASQFWRKFWSLKLPPKVANLVWRAGTNCLPTLTQLRVKRVDVSSICPVCGEHEETILHCLVTCNIIKQCWDRVGIGTQTRLGGTFFYWCIKVFRVSCNDLKCLLAVTCWAICEARNDLVWNRKEHTVGNGHWSSNDVNSVRINVDAAIFDGGRSYGLGMVIRDVNGMLLEGRTTLAHTQVDPLLAEAIGV
uniref:Reverse transcriptase domain-containing protein n=1 Tax=Cannabis sativa TaxID=3483 RepID=A0A803PKR6_CANSA